MITDEHRKALIEAACEVRRFAYAPYSKYTVGAAILTDDGHIVTGANVEIASYGLTNCAERSAVFTAVSTGVRRILAVAVCTKNAGTPCGACRQVLSEFVDNDVPILLSDDQGRVRETTLFTLLPEHFGPGHLV